MPNGPCAGVTNLRLISELPLENRSSKNKARFMATATAVPTGPATLRISVILISVNKASPPTVASAAPVPAPTEIPRFWAFPAGEKGLPESGGREDEPNGRDPPAPPPPLPGPEIERWSFGL